MTLTKIRQVFLLVTGPKTSSPVPCLRYEVPLLQRSWGKPGTIHPIPDELGEAAYREVDLATEAARLQGHFPKEFAAVYPADSFKESLASTLERDSTTKVEGLDLEQEEISRTSEELEPLETEVIKGVGHALAILLREAGMPSIVSIATATLDDLEAIQGISPASSIKIKDQAAVLAKKLLTD